LPPGTVSGVIDFVPGVIKAFRSRGFLTVANPTFDHVVAAAFGMLHAAFQAGIRAPADEAEAEAPPPPPPAEALPPRPESPPPAPLNAADEEARRRAYFEQLARATS